jgi:N-acyl-D-amino-acid deacylase
MGDTAAVANTAPPPVLIRGVDVVDGTGGDPFVADVRVEGGVVVGVGPSLTSTPGDTVVDGDGLALAPGFVDLHSHSDLYTLVPAGAPGTVGDGPKLLQGCTTQVFGQDGISAAPVHRHDVDEFTRFLAGLDGEIDRSRWTWSSFGEYLAAVRRGSTTRTAGLVGHATVRRYVMGMANRPPTGDELQTMQAVVADALDQGAAGFSTGLVYVPAAFATTEEVTALCEVAAGRDKPFFVHVRSESEHVVEATDEVIEVAARSGVHLHYSHIKTAGERNWGKASTMLAQLEAAASSGVRVTADIHPYIAGSSTSIVLLPPWLQDGTMADIAATLADPAVRERVRGQMLADVDSWDNWYDFSGGWEGLRVAGARRGDLVGSTFADLIRRSGVADIESPAAFDVVFDLLASEAFGVTLISFNNVEANVARFFAQPYTSVGSDGVVNPGGLPHPRLYGTFPRVLGRLVREQGVVSLPEAVRKMTSQAAEIVGLGDRIGRVAVGRPADLVLFDPATIIDRATYEEPRRPGEGVTAVWVGGRLVAEAGRSAPEIFPAEEDR